jgi:hypothetical protein
MIEYTVKVYPDGSKYWYLNGKLHCEDGPAIYRADGSKSWWLNGKLHREDGPAVECADCSKHWCLNDKKVTEEEVLALQEIVIDGKRYRRIG